MLKVPSITAITESNFVSMDSFKTIYIIERYNISHKAYFFFCELKRNGSTLMLSIINSVLK